MNAIIRHDHYPNRHANRHEAPARQIAGPARFQATRGLACAPSGAARWRVRPVRTAPPPPDIPPVDVARVFAALFGLGVYVGVPSVALAYLALSLTH